MTLARENSRADFFEFGEELEAKNPAYLTLWHAFHVYVEPFESQRADDRAWMVATAISGAKFDHSLFSLSGYGPIKTDAVGVKAQSLEEMRRNARVGLKIPHRVKTKEKGERRG